MSFYKTRYKKKYLHKKAIFSWSIIIIILLVFGSIVLFEKAVLPTLVEISHTRSKSVANEILDTSINELLAEMPLTSSDFILPSQGDSSQLNINTQAINQFCSDLSISLNEKIEDLPYEVLQIPLGSATQLNLLANKGPMIPFTLLPAGVATSDYETAFFSTGINQVNYKIWIYVNLEIQIVNPFYKEKVSLTKKIMLVDTIIRGQVPEQYFHLNP